MSAIRSFLLQHLFSSPYCTFIVAFTLLHVSYRHQMAPGIVVPRVLILNFLSCLLRGPDSESMIHNNGKTIINSGRPAVQQLYDFPVCRVSVHI